MVKPSCFAASLGPVPRFFVQDAGGLFGHSGQSNPFARFPRQGTVASKYRLCQRLRMTTDFSLPLATSVDAQDAPSIVAMGKTIFSLDRW